MACVVAKRVGWLLISSMLADAGPAGVLRGDRSDVFLMVQELGAARGRERSMAGVQSWYG